MSNNNGSLGVPSLGGDSIRERIRLSCRLMEAQTGRMEQTGSDYFVRLAILDLYDKLDAITPPNRLPSQYEKAMYQPHAEQP